MIGESVHVELCTLRLGLDLIRIDRAQHRVDLTLQQRGHHRGDRHVDHVDVRFLEVVRLQEQRQHRRLRRGRRHTHLLPLEIGHRFDARLLERHDGIRIRLVNRRDDLHRRTLGDELAHGNRIGIGELRTSVRNELRGVAGAVALHERDIEPSVLVVALRNRGGESGVGAAGHPVQLKGDRRVGRGGIPGRNEQPRCESANQHRFEHIKHVTSSLKL